MPLFDSHCHLTADVLYRDLPGVCSRARAAGVTRMITVGTSAVDSRRAVAVADLYQGVYATVGIHPHECDSATPEDWRLLRELRHNPNVVAWGEIGLDYYYDFADRALQQDVFRRQLQLVARTRLPVVIHCRDAVEDTAAILEDQGFAGRKVVFHCFTGTAAQARALTDRGWWLSFTGIVTFKNSAVLQQIAKDYPLDQLMLETDSPYLAPEPHRKIKPNEPRLLVHTAEFLADLKGISVDQLAQTTAANTSRFFGI